MLSKYPRFQMFCTNRSGSRRSEAQATSPKFHNEEELNYLLRLFEPKSFSEFSHISEFSCLRAKGRVGQRGPICPCVPADMCSVTCFEYVFPEKWWFSQLVPTRNSFNPSEPEPKANRPRGTPLRFSWSRQFSKLERL